MSVLLSITGCLQLAPEAVSPGWRVVTSKPKLPTVGMTEEDVDQMLGPEWMQFLHDGRPGNTKCWNRFAGVISVYFEMGRVKDVQFYPDDAPFWQRLIGWLFFRN
jgi:hypothetical protein